MNRIAGTISKVEGRWGWISFYGKDEYVGKSLWNYGEYNPQETEMILSLATPGRLCLDIGANFGVMAQALVYNGFDCVAFEPQPEVFKVLTENVSCRCFNVGLGDVPGTAKMPKLNYAEKNNIGGMGIGFKSHLGTIDVAVETLDMYGFENVGFMKIDVEGFEEKVLRGGTETILRDKPIMYIEDDRQSQSYSLRKYIRELGYTIEEHKPPLFSTPNFFNCKKNVWEKNFVSHNIICRPI